MKDSNEFITDFLKTIPSLDIEADNYANEYLTAWIKTADQEVHHLFFPSATKNEKEIWNIRVPELSVLCVSCILSVCNNPSISGRFKTPCDQQIKQWFELNGSEIGQMIFKDLLDKKLNLAECTQKCISDLCENLKNPSFKILYQIFAQTKTPVPAQLIVSAMEAIDSRFGVDLITNWLSELPKNHGDFEWWDSFQQIQIYPWFHGVSPDYFRTMLKTEVANVLHNNPESIQTWLNSVNGPDKYGLLNWE